jgi:uncharacterized membrane protein YdjX (TVP38/TMEM64 family)
MTSLTARVGLLIALLAALVAAALTVDLPDVDVVREWIMSFGALAPVVFVVAYALAVPIPIPKSVLNAVAGVVFGASLGIPLVVIGATTGAVGAFGLARLLGRDAVDRLASGHLHRVDAAVERHGVLAALLVRLIPILPFTVLNYACGVTAMRLRHYVLGTMIGLIPGASALVVLGSTGARISLWVPAIVSVSLGLVSLGIGLAWSHHNSRHQDTTASQ